MQLNFIIKKKERPRAFLLLLCLLFCHVDAFSQSWYKTNKGNQLLNSYSLTQCYDFGLAAILDNSNSLAGSLIKTDVNGNLIWTCGLDTAYNFTAVSATADGGFILGGWHTHLPGGTFLLKLNACGEKEWSGFFAGYDTTDSWVYEVCQAKDHGYIASLTSYGINSSAICKLDSNGKAEWTVYLKNVLLIDKILLCNDGSFLITCDHYTPIKNNPSNTGARACMVKVNARGKILWSFNYGINEGWLSFGEASYQKSDHGYLSVIGDFSSTSAHCAVRLMMQDSSGNEIWTKLIGDTSIQEEPMDMVYDSIDNTFIIPAAIPITNSGSSIYYCKTFRIDGYGDVLDTMSYPYNNLEDYMHIIPTYGRKFLICGDEDVNGSYNTFAAWKINPDLSQADFDNTSRSYDYLCHTKIPSQFSVDLKGSFNIKIDTNTEAVLADSNVNTGIAHVNTFYSGKVGAYPNPFINKLNLTASGLTPAEGVISVIDMQGREVYRTPCSISKDFNTQIDLTTLQPGLYILKISSEYDNYTVKVSKM